MIPKFFVCSCCESKIPYGARKCRHCGEWLDGRRSPSFAQVNWVIGLLLSLCWLLFFLGYLLVSQRFTHYDAFLR